MKKSDFTASLRERRMSGSTKPVCVSRTWLVPGGGHLELWCPLAGVQQSSPVPAARHYGTPLMSPDWALRA